MTIFDWVAVAYLAAVLVQAGLSPHAFEAEMAPTLPPAEVAMRGAGAISAEVTDGTLSKLAAMALPSGLAQRVSASARGGVIVLEGRVESETDRRRILSLVGEIPGCRGVIDHLVVQAP